MSFKNLAILSGMGTILGGSYLCCKEDLSKTEKRIAQLVTGASALGFAIACYKLLDGNRVKPVSTEVPHAESPVGSIYKRCSTRMQEGLVPDSEIDKKADQIIYALEGMNHDFKYQLLDWEEGDLVVMGALSKKDNCVIVYSVEFKNSPLCIQNVESELEDVFLSFTGDNLANLKKYYTKWDRFELFRPIKAVGDRVTFRHIRSGNVFQADTSTWTAYEELLKIKELNEETSSS